MDRRLPIATIVVGLAAGAVPARAHAEADPFGAALVALAQAMAEEETIPTTQPLLDLGVYLHDGLTVAGTVDLGISWGTWTKEFLFDSASLHRAGVSARLALDDHDRFATRAFFGHCWCGEAITASADVGVDVRWSDGPAIGPSLSVGARVFNVGLGLSGWLYAWPEVEIGGMVGIQVEVLGNWKPASAGE